MSLKVSFIARQYFFPSFWQYLNSKSEKRHVIWNEPRFDQFFGIFIGIKMLLSQAKYHWSDEVIIGRDNIW